MSRSDGTFEHVACVETFDEAKQVKERVGNLVFEDIPVVLNDGMIVMSFTPAIIQFKTTSCGANHNLKSRAGSNAKQDTYINACYIDDAFCLMNCRMISRFICLDMMDGFQDMCCMMHQVGVKRG